MNVNEIIKKRRKELGLTLKDVANELGVSESLISRYESNDVKNMGIDKIKPLAKVLKCSPAYLMGWEKEEQTKKNSESNIDMNNIIRGDEFSMIPLYESISAGYGSEEADFIEMLAIPTLKNPQDCFAVRVRGDSMEDKIEDGSIIIVRRDCCIDDGEIGAFFYEGKSIVKQKKIYKNTIVLRSYNKEYEDLIVDEYSEFKEYGKVVMSINRF